MRSDSFFERGIGSLFLWLLNSILATTLLASCSTPLPETSTPVSTEAYSCASGGTISVSTDYVYYRITGSAADEFRAQMDQFGYTDESGHRWDAYTEWHVSWAYPYSTTADGCAAGPVDVKVEVTVFLPKW